MATALDVVLYGGAALVAAANPLAGAAAAGAAALISQTFREERRRRQEQFTEAVLAKVDQEVLIDRAINSPRFLDLATEAGDAALRTDWAAKRVLLARSLARAAADDARVDAERRFVRVVDQIEPVEARLLAAMASPPDRSEGEDRIRGALHRNELETVLGGDTETLDASLAVLSGAGLAVDIAVRATGSLQAWEITEYGRRFLRWLQDAEA